MALPRWSSIRSARTIPRAPARPVKPLRAGGPERMEDRCSPTTWLGNTTGSQNFSDPTQWNTGVPISSPATALTFNNNTQTGYTANNDLGTLTLNSVDFNTRYGYFDSTITFFINGATVSGDGLSFSAGGAGFPFIRQDGSAAVSFEMPGIQYTDPLTLNGSGNGTLYIFGSLEPTGSTQATIDVDRGGAGFTVLDGADLSNAEVDLTSGKLEFGDFGSDQGNPLVINGGTVYYGSEATGVGSNFSTSNPYSLNTTLTVGGVGSNTANGVISGQGGISLETLLPTTFTIGNTDTYAGATVAGPSLLSAKGSTFVIGNDGDLVGQVINTSSLTAARGGTIEVDNTTDPITNVNPDHIADTVPLTLESGGTFDYVPYVPGTLADNRSTETIGSLNVSGNPTVTVAGSSPSSTTAPITTYGIDGTVTFTDYTQSADAAVLYQGQNLGSLNNLTNNDYIYITNDAGVLSDLVGGGGVLGTQNISILPSAYGNTWTTAQNGTGDTLVTYTAATGIRPLQFSEYQPSITQGVTSTADVRLTGVDSISGQGTQINALVLSGNGTNYGKVQGNGQLFVDSGVILASGTGNAAVGSANRERIDAGSLDFGANPGNIIVPGTLTISSPISGLNGYSVSGAGDLALTGDNTNLDGSVTLAGGNTTVATVNANLGGSSLIFDGGTLTVSTADETVNRSILVDAGGGFVSLAPGASENLAGAINGSGDFELTGGGNLELSGTNAFTGNYIVTDGSSLQLDSALALGNATSLTLATGTTLDLPNALTISRPVELIATGTNFFGTPNPTGSATIDNANAVTVNSAIGVNGDVYADYGLNKTGAGDLTLNNEQSFTGPLDIQQGRVLVNGQLDALNQEGNGVTVESGATLAGTGDVIRDVQVNSGGTLSPGGGSGLGILQTGALTMAAGSTFSDTLDSATAGTGYGQLDVTGAITLNNPTLNLNLGYTPAIGDTFTIIHNVDNTPITGTFIGLAEGTKIVTPQGTFRITYLGGTGGHDVVLTTLDTTPPILVAIGRGTPSTATTNASQVTFNVDFSKKVVGVSTANFAIVGTAAASATFGTISTSDGGMTWQFPILGLANANGTIGLNLTSGLGIQDTSGNLLTTQTLTGAVYTLDHVPPTTAATLATGQAASTGVTPIAFTVTFSKPVTGFTASSVVVSGSAGPAHVTVTGSGSSYTVDVGRVNGNGDVDLKVNAGAAKDAAGNSSTASNTATATYTLASLFVVGGGPGTGPDVRVYDAGSAQLRYNFFAYAPGFEGGVSVATGNITGTATTPEIVTGSGPGAGPNVDVFDGATGEPLAGYSFYAFDPAYVGGITVAAGDLTGSGHDDIIVSTDAGSEPHVIVFDGLTLKVIASFYAFDKGFLGGVNVAAADVEGIGHDDLIVGAASGNSPHVEVFRLNGSGGVTLVQSFLAAGITGKNGISVSGGISAAGNANADIVVGDLVDGTVAIYNGADDSLKTSFDGMEPGVTNVGARVASIDSTGDGITDTIVVGSGPSVNPRFRRYDAVTGGIVDETPVFDPLFMGGVFVG